MYLLIFSHFARRIKYHFKVSLQLESALHHNTSLQIATHNLIHVDITDNSTQLCPYSYLPDKLFYNIHYRQCGVKHVQTLR